MSAALRVKVGVCAAGLSYLLMVGPAQAQQQNEGNLIKPAQYADQDTGQPLMDRDTNSGQAVQQGQATQGERSTTYFRGPDSAGANAESTNASIDRYLANCLMIKNQAEIEANQFALERIESDEVKQFAEQMVQDHRQLAEKLQQVAGAREDSSGDAALNQLLELDRQITDQCASIVRDKLSQKSGAEFDRCFVGSQVGNHIHMLAALTVISEQAGGELRQVAADAKASVEKHLAHAEKLAKQLEEEHRG